MFHPPRIPQWQWNGNGAGFQRVPVENPLNADVAPIANPFFSAVASRCWPNGRCWKCNGFINLLNLRLDLLNCNGFCNGLSVATSWTPVGIARGAIFDD